MKIFAGILAFIVVFVPFITFGVFAALVISDGDKGPGRPLLAVIVFVAFTCIGAFAGSYSSRVTRARYGKQKQDTAA